MSVTSLPLLQLMQNYFGCGNIYIREDRKIAWFRINSIYELWHIVVPHFLKYPVTGSKNNSFFKFLQVLIILYPFVNKKKDSLTMAKAIVAEWNMNSEDFESQQVPEETNIHDNSYDLMNLSQNQTN